MLSIYACSLLICAASLAIGRAILVALGGPRPAWLSAATGFAALVIAAPLLIRLPGRATTAAILIGIAVIAGAAISIRDLRRPGGAEGWKLGAGVVVIVLAVAAVPFLVSDHVGVLGEGVYTNDHAAQLYWADWLQRGFGPEPSAVRFGYPIGPQAVAVIAAQVTGASLVSAFNGLLLAIPALTALTALAGLQRMPAGRRIAIAAIVGLPYLAASFMAQSAFKETAMALFVLAFALALATRDRVDTADSSPAPRWRSIVAVGLLLAGASVFTFSAPGLAWFAIALPLWLVLEALDGRSPADWGAVRDGLAAHKVTLAVAIVILIGIAAVAFTPAREFASKIADVQASAGRLSSPVFPGEAFGIWPAGDFRIVRGDVSGSWLAVGIGLLAAAYGAWVLIRTRQLALLATLVTGGLIYIATRAVAEIHVQAKALAVIAPLVMLISLRALLQPSNNEQRTTNNLLRYAFGTLIALAATLSTLLALRDAPVGFDHRQLALERLAERAEGEPVAFLGVDRFAGYYLRETLARAPAGYVPEEIEARPEKTWQQGLAADFDSLDSGQLDRFKYAITTDAGFASTPPPNFERVAADGDYVLWERQGETPRAKVLDDEGGDPGATLSCASGKPQRRGTAVVLAEPAIADYGDWDQPAPPDARVAGQERGWQAPGRATIPIELDRDGGYRLSLQYQSQVPLTVSFDGERVAELPASLEGMYLSGAGRGAFWPAGTVDADAGKHEVEVEAAGPSGLAGTLDARRLVWLGNVAASPTTPARTVSLASACDLYVDHFAYERKGGKG